MPHNFPFFSTSYQKPWYILADQILRSGNPTVGKKWLFPRHVFHRGQPVLVHYIYILSPRPYSNLSFALTKGVTLSQLNKSSWWLTYPHQLSVDTINCFNPFNISQVHSANSPSHSRKKWLSDVVRNDCSINFHLSKLFRNT